jgi:hypothetical protein
MDTKTGLGRSIAKAQPNRKTYFMRFSVMGLYKDLADHQKHLRIICQLVNSQDLS